MSRMILQYPETKITLQQALEFVAKVVKSGRISNRNKQFCYVTQFNHIDLDVTVYAGVTRTGTDTFSIVVN